MTRHLVVVLGMLCLGLPAMAHAQSARAQLKDARANVVGTATLSELPGGVRITLRVNGLRRERTSMGQTPIGAAPENHVRIGFGT